MFGIRRRRTRLSLGYTLASFSAVGRPPMRRSSTWVGPGPYVRRARPTDRWPGSLRTRRYLPPRPRADLSVVSVKTWFPSPLSTGKTQPPGGSRQSTRQTCRAVRRSGPQWHSDGMSRTRLSTTVDAELLDGARGIRSGSTDAALIDEALRALLARHRSAEVDASYAVYDEHPADEPDEWGDLASWRRAAGAS